MYPPTTLYRVSKWISMNLPKREELLFRVVFALPKASKIGLAVTDIFSTKSRLNEDYAGFSFTAELQRGR